MKRITPLLAGSVLLLFGYVGVKSSFDCDATMSDICMTMTRVNQLVRDKATKQVGKLAADGLLSLVDLPATSAVETPSVSRFAVSLPSGMWIANTTPPVSAGTSTGVNTNTTASTLTLRPVTGTPVTTTPSSAAYRPVVSAVTSTPPCQNVCCNNSGSMHPQRSQDQIATVWIVSWVDSDNVFHQPGRVLFVVNSANWALSVRVN